MSVAKHRNPASDNRYESQPVPAPRSPTQRLIGEPRSEQCLETSRLLPPPKPPQMRKAQDFVAIQSPFPALPCHREPFPIIKQILLIRSNQNMQATELAEDSGLDNAPQRDIGGRERRKDKGTA